MKEKEKATELVDKYLDVCEVFQYETKYMTVDMAKDSAKIHINGLIEYAKTFGDVTDLDIKEFNEVLKEIDNI